MASGCRAGLTGRGAGKKAHAHGSATAQTASGHIIAAGHGYPAVHITQHGGFASASGNGPGRYAPIGAPQHHGVVGGGVSLHRQGKAKTRQYNWLPVHMLRRGLLASQPLQKGSQKNLRGQRKAE